MDSRTGSISRETSRTSSHSKCMIPPLLMIISRASARVFILLYWKVFQFSLFSALIDPDLSVGTGPNTHSRTHPRISSSTVPAPLSPAERASVTPAVRLQSHLPSAPPLLLSLFLNNEHGSEAGMGNVVGGGFKRCGGLRGLGQEDGG